VTRRRCVRKQRTRDPAATRRPAARLQEGRSPGRPRRAASPNSRTNAAGLLARAPRACARLTRRPSAATAAVNSPTQRSRPAAPARRGDSGAIAALGRPHLYPSGDLGWPSTTRSVRRVRHARRGRYLKVQLACWTPATIAGDSASPPGCVRPSSADWRNQAAETSPRLQSCAPSAPSPGRAAYLLEPDLRSRGGLRDATALRAGRRLLLATRPRGLADARRRLLDVRDAST